MKPRFLLFSLLLIGARGCDFYSTSLWFFQENGQADEMNPLTRFLGFGWDGLVFTNVVLVALIIAAWYYYCFKFQRPMQLSPTPSNYKAFISQLYFGVPDKFVQVAYRMPKDKKVLFAHSGYVIIRVLIVASLLATVHNLGQFYGYAWYGTFREFVGRPLWVIYGLIGVAAIITYRNLFRLEFATYQQQYASMS